MDMGQTKTAPYQTAIAKQFPYLIGVGIRGDIEVLGFTSKQQIAHAATDQACTKTGTL